MYIKNKRGQSTVEYVLLVTAVIAVIIALVTSNSNGLQGKLSNSINTTTDTMGTMSDRLQTTQNGNAAGDGSQNDFTVNAAG